MSDTTGTGPLIRLILRRDRIRLPLWIIGITAVNAASAAAVKGTYNTSAEIAAYGPTAGDSAAGRITSGRQAALDTIGGIVANETTLIATVGVTLMVLFLVVRHTRAEEESGAFELVRSGVVGRHAQTLAVVAVAIAASVLIGLLHTVAFIGLGFDLTGSVAFGAEIAVLGVLFTGIAAAAAQVTESARGALGIGGAILGVTYVLRGVGAVGDNALYWLSPFGWAQTVDAFGDERWWLLGVVLLAATACCALAAGLTTRRDAGAGLLATRPGPARAGTHLGSPAGLALRTQRGLIIGWAIGICALAAVYGSVIPEVPKMLESNPDIAKAIGLDASDSGALIDGFLGYINLTLGVIAAVFGVSSALRLRQEEESGRLEALLATPLQRDRWALGSFAVTVAGVLLMGLAMGLGMVLGYVAVSGDGSRTSRLMLGPLAQVPAMLLVAAVTFLLVTWVPRWSMLAWLFVVWVVLEAYLGETLKLPDAVRSFSPFHYLPVYPTHRWTLGPSMVLTGLALACVGLGAGRLRRRDLG